MDTHVESEKLPETSHAAELHPESEKQPEETSNASELKAHSTIEDPEELSPHLHAKTWLTVLAVCLIYFAQLINVVGAGALGQDIDAVIGGSSKLVWLTSVIAIITTVLSPPACQAADYWGRRWPLIILTSCGIFGSIIVARATSMNMAIAGEVVTSLSFGAQPLVHAVASEVLPRRYRPFAQAADNVAAALGGIIALLVGGAMTRDNKAGFRNYWYMCAAIYAVATILCLILYHPPRRDSQAGTNMEKLKKLDWVGYFLLVSGLVLFSMGLAWSQNPYSWTNVHILATFLIGCALIGVLVVYEWKIKSDGMFHHGLFAGRANNNLALAISLVFVEGLVFYAANNYFAFEVGVLFETDPVRTGARYAINFITYALFAVLGGAFCSKTKMIKYPVIIGFASMLIFFICMSTVGLESSKPVWAYPIFLGIGLGVVLCGLVSTAQFSAPPDFIATTSGLMISVRSLGGTVGIAIFNAVFTAKFSGNIGSKIAAAVLPLGFNATELPALIGALAADNTTAVGLIPGVTAQIAGAGVEGLLEAYAIGFRFVWISSGCFVVVALIASFLLVDPTKEFNMHIDAPAEKTEDLYSSR